MLGNFAQELNSSSFRLFIVECALSFFDPDLSVSPEKSCYGDSETVTLNCSNQLGGPPFNECANGYWVFPSASCEGISEEKHFSAYHI